MKLNHQLIQTEHLTAQKRKLNHLETIICNISFIIFVKKDIGGK